MMTGVKSLCGIAQFGRDRGAALAHALGFRRGKTPAVSSFSELFRALDIEAFEAALSRWIAARRPPGAERVVSLDGKTARGSKDGEAPGQHLVAAYDADARAVLAQIRVDAKTNEHKAALQLLGILPLKGTIFVGDAMFCQRDLCAAIIEGGGDYVFFVKDNQPSLDVDIGAGLAYEAQARSQAAAFSPRCAACCGPRGGPDEQGTRSGRETHPADNVDPDEAAGLGWAEAGLRVDARADDQAGTDRGDRAWHHEPQLGESRRGAVAAGDTAALGHRERAPLPSGCDAGGGCEPGPQGRRPASDGGPAEQHHSRPRGHRGQPRRRHAQTQ